MIISIIAAISDNYVLGKDNKLVWSMPDDVAYYKKTISHKTIIMGRKTAESPDMFFSSKRNILITRKEGFKLPNFETAHSLKEAIAMCEEKEEIFITGGSQIYREALTIADKLYLTRIHQTFEGDAFFPEFDNKDWMLTSKDEHSSDEKNPFDFTFFIYSRKA